MMSNWYSNWRRDILVKEANFGAYDDFRQLDFWNAVLPTYEISYYVRVLSSSGLLMSYFSTSPQQNLTYCNSLTVHYTETCNRTFDTAVKELVTSSSTDDATRWHDVMHTFGSNGSVCNAAQATAILVPPDAGCRKLHDGNSNSTGRSRSLHIAVYGVNKLIHDICTMASCFWYGTSEPQLLLQKKCRNVNPSTQTLWNKYRRKFHTAHTYKTTKQTLLHLQIWTEIF